MAFDTAILQGRFTSTGANVTIPLRSDVDWMEVYNYTAVAQTAADLACKFFWQRGMAQGGGIVYTNQGAQALNPLSIAGLAANTGFFLIDSSVVTPGAAIATTTVTNVTSPVVSTANTGLLTTPGANDQGGIVRLVNSDTTGLNGFDFEVGTVVANTSFAMRFAMATAPGAAGTAGFYRYIPYDAMFYPRNRTIVNITQAANAAITTSVSHGMTVGQKIRISIPRVTGVFFGMTELDGLEATVVSVTNRGTFTIDIDTTAMTAFSWPTTALATANLPYTLPQMVPFGENTAAALTAGVNILADSTLNTAVLGMLLVGGAASPAGAASDVIYWRAGKSFSVSNT